MSTMGIAASFVMCTVYRLSVGFCLPECLVFADFPPRVFVNKSLDLSNGGNWAGFIGWF